jgi:tRNA(Ile)-lysidine synthase
MHPLAARVRRTIERSRLIPPGSRVVAAVSGGADSVALLFLLHELSTAGAAAGAIGPGAGFHLVGLCHLHHGLRGEAADADEAFCRQLAAELGLPIEVERIDVAALARAEGLSIEAAGRAARLAFFERACRRLGADCVGVGHTKDDQAETFLLRLLRGAGPRGLAGIFPRVGVIVRPLLGVGRAELVAYLRDRGRGWRDDATNRDLAVPRNRLRHELLPYLRQHFSPAISDVLARAAIVARDDAEFLERATEDAAETIVRVEAGGLRLERARLAALPVALARRVARRALQQTAPGRFIGFDHVEALLELVRGPQAGRLALPGQEAIACGEAVQLVARPRGRRTVEAPVNLFRYALSVPGEVVVPEAGVRVRADWRPEAGALLDAVRARANWTVAAAAAVALPLAVRNRRPGDLVRLVGGGARKKLQDLFVDRKVPRAERDRVVLVVDGRDRIVWVAGHGVDHEVRVTDRRAAVIILTVEPLGGSA